jgi:hypothetical protein
MLNRNVSPGRLAAACLAVLLGWAATAGAVPTQTLESRAYRIHTNLTPAEAQEYGRHMDLIYREYSRRFAVLHGSDRDKQDLYLLRTREDYIAEMAEFGIDATATGGVFFWGPRGTGLATWVEGPTREQVYSTLQHEGFHQFAHSKLGRELPLWVNEGLAEYFGSAIVVKDRVRLGIVDADRVQSIRDALERGTALGFDELLTTDPGRWRSNMQNGSVKGHLQYDQSWSVVHFLIHGDRGRYREAFGNYLVHISRGRNHEQAFRQSFGTDETGPFAQRWRRFVERVEADDYSTMLRRLHFLVAGLEFLSQQGDAAPPTSTQELRVALQQRGFRLSRQTESGVTVIDAADDALFGYAGEGGKTVSFTVVPAEGEGLPPQITAEHIKPRATLTWTRDAEGYLRSQVVYE